MLNSNSEVILKPVAVYMDPFRKAPNVLVLCDTWVANKKESMESGELVYKPHPDNTRYNAVDMFSKNNPLPRSKYLLLEVKV